MPIQENGAPLGLFNPDRGRAAKDAGPSASGDAGNAPPRCRKGRWRRRLVLLVLILGGVLGGLFLWLDAEGTLPDIEGLLPAGGRWISVEVPRGLLDKELERGITVLRDYALRPGALSEGRPELDDLPLKDSALLEELILRSRPWRVTFWDGDDGSKLIIGSTAGMANAVRWVPDRGPRRTIVRGVPLSVAFRGGTFVVGTRERVQAVLEALPHVKRSSVESGCFGIRFEAPSEAQGAHLWSPSKPGGIARLSGRLRPQGRGCWSFEFELVPRGGPPSSWGPDAWREALEMENVRVLMRDACQPVRDATSPGVVPRYRGAWTVEGLARAVDELNDSLEFWGERGRR